MVSILLFSFACLGMTQIIVYGSIFDRLRPTKGLLGDLVSCPMCTGFWVGVFLWAISPNTELFRFDTSLTTALLLGCYSSAVSYIGSMLVGDCGLKISHHDGSEE
jgi:hypothetical protein